MSELSAFYAQNAVQLETEDYVVSDRFKGTNGEPLPWRLRSITAAEDEECRKASTRRVKNKSGQQTAETNMEEYLAKMAVACIEFPNLKDAELQQSYRVLGADNLLRAMLRAGEYVTLIQKVQQINGYDKDMNELVEEAKN